jgi:demethylmenaquinone methyltransferase/2-methoxy-6-polyprenyl-1,4-benzoquinol methylase
VRDPGGALPKRVADACARAEAARFELSCEPEVGRLLAALAAAVRPRGRVLELGTGAGVGLAWLVSGLGERTDVEVVSVEAERGIQEVAAAGAWPSFVRLELGDGAELVRELGQFDLVFPDAPGGKLFGLDRTIDALQPGGILVVDDMDPRGHEDPELRAALAGVRERLLTHPDLVAAELEASSGIVLATRRARRD